MIKLLFYFTVILLQSSLISICGKKKVGIKNGDTQSIHRGGNDNTQKIKNGESEVDNDDLLQIKGSGKKNKKSKVKEKDLGEIDMYPGICNNNANVNNNVKPPLSKKSICETDYEKMVEEKMRKDANIVRKMDKKDNVKNDSIKKMEKNIPFAVPIQGGKQSCHQDIQPIKQSCRQEVQGEKGNLTPDTPLSPVSPILPLSPSIVPVGDAVKTIKPMELKSEAKKNKQINSVKIGLPKPAEPEAYEALNNINLDAPPPAAVPQGGDCYECVDVLKNYMAAPPPPQTVGINKEPPDQNVPSLKEFNGVNHMSGNEKLSKNEPVVVHFDKRMNLAKMISNSKMKEADDKIEGIPSKRRKKASNKKKHSEDRKERGTSNKNRNGKHRSNKRNNQ
uniref:Uncharacterized protein n=1 Tax=Parastrongyloides trichosuri TaxID=131310 RepID=A0A0N4ZJY6_PARTI